MEFHITALRHLAALFTFLAMLPAQAGPPDVIEARVVPGWIMADGVRHAAIDIRLAPGWKTYWRHPGAGGIAPAFDWSGSDNLAGIEIRWPHPDVFDDYGLRTVGYADRVVLPLAVTPDRPGAPVRLQARAEIGVCRDVCLPVTLSIAATLPTGTEAPAADRREVLSALRTARSAAPGAGRARCALSPIADGLRLKVTFRKLPDVGPVRMAFIATDRADVWVSEPEMTTRAGGLVATADLVPPEAQPFALDRSAMRFTLLGETGTTDILGCDAG